MDNATINSTKLVEDEDGEFAADFFDDNDPDFADIDEDMNFNDDCNTDNAEFADDDDDWGTLEDLSYDPQALLMYRQSSQMDEDVKKRKNTLISNHSSAVFWKCIHCSFLNPPSNMNCMSCKRHRNAFNCLQYKLVESTNANEENNSNSENNEWVILKSEEVFSRTELLICGVYHENQPQITCELLIKDIQVLIMLFIPNYIAFGIGANSRGEMGLGNNRNFQNYQKLDQLSLLMSDPEYDFYIGFGRYLVRTINDEIYVCGNNKNKECGIGSNEISICNFTKLNFDLETKNIEKQCQKAQEMKDFDQMDIHIGAISNGGYSSHSLLYCSDTTFYGIGDSNNGQFGNIQIPDNNNLPLFLQNLSDFFCKTIVVKIECGQSHTVFLTENYELFACGDTEFGQCGLSSTDNYTMNDGSVKNMILVPSKLDLPPIKDIHVGYTHNICLTRDESQLYVFGDSRYGQLGLGEECIIQKPTLHKFFVDTEIVQIGCGLRSSYTIDFDGACYIFGRNDHSQIGKSRNMKNVHDPHHFQSEGYDAVVVEQISLGAFHTVLLTDDNGIMAFGNNTNGQCSPRMLADSIPCVNIPYLVGKDEIGLEEDQYISRVIAGFNSTIIFVDIRCRNLKNILPVFNNMDYDQAF